MIRNGFMGTIIVVTRVIRFRTLSALSLALLLAIAHIGPAPSLAELQRGR